MDEESDADDLMAQAAAHNQVPVEVMRALMGLERDFPDFTQFGSKSAFTRRVAQILDEAASAADGADLT